jgi:hypothetical protein
MQCLHGSVQHAFYDVAYCLYEWLSLWSWTQPVVWYSMNSIHHPSAGDVACALGLKGFICSFLWHHHLLNVMDSVGAACQGEKVPCTCCSAQCPPVVVVASQLLQSLVGHLKAMRMSCVVHCWQPFQSSSGEGSTCV